MKPKYKIGQYVRILPTAEEVSMYYIFFNQILPIEAINTFEGRIEYRFELNFINNYCLERHIQPLNEEPNGQMLFDFMVE